uniref:EGF-like domain-containing protein n=1 Tax=Macrostomum lignano TaxID=282301 RepID=A0A1I8FC46_9PLAT
LKQLPWQRVRVRGHGTPLPVFFPSLPSDSSANSNVEGNATFVQGNLDIFFRPMDSSSPSPTQRQLTALIKLSEPVLANIALLTAASKSDSIQNLFALSNLTAMDERKTTTYASWTIEQTIWNQVLFKATNTTIKRCALSSGLAVALLNQDQRATQYEFTRVQRNWLTLESLVANAPNRFHGHLGPFAELFKLRLGLVNCLLERDYNQLDMPEGFHFTRLVGNNVTRLRTCRDLTCGPGSQCVVKARLVRAQCRCLPGYVESGAGACRAVCGPNLCDVNAECLINKCICASGYSGDGLVCQADDRDCRLAQAACRPEDGFACMQQATRSGIEYRCQCGSSKCIREADAACRQQAGCSQFANCLPGANGGPSTCVCPSRAVAPTTPLALTPVPTHSATPAACVRHLPSAKSIAGGQPSDCMENAQCDPVSNACVCKPGFAANRLGGCSIACRTV